MRYIFSLLLLSFSCLVPAQVFQDQQQLARFAHDSKLWFGVHSNLLPQANQLTAIIRLENHSPQALPAGQQNWHIYFHFIRHIPAFVSHGLAISHVQGDLHRISPTAEFSGLAPGQQLEILVASSPWLISYSDFMPRAFITSGTLAPEIFRNTDTESFRDFVLPLNQPEQLLRNSGEPDRTVKPDAASRFAHYQSLSDSNISSGSSNRIIPAPYYNNLTSQRFTLNNSWQLAFEPSAVDEGSYLQQQLHALYQLPLQTTDYQQVQKSQIRLQLQPGMETGPESYQLLLEPERILITGYDNAGLFYGVQSLLALLDNQQPHPTLPTGIIEDKPRAAWRGLHYDMARNFHGKDVTLRLIEQMGRYKLNKLHLHLTEDEGWRLEIPGLPELTELGAFRCFDLVEQQCLLTQLGTGPHRSGSGNGFYSVSDFIEILQFARQHHIEVIPEIDLPGHARAAIKAMELRYQRLMVQKKPAEASRYLLSDPEDTSQYLSVQNYTDNAVNVCRESTYHFIEKITDALQQMYQQAGLQLNILHIGGDEVAKGAWQGSLSCQQLFNNPDNQLSSVTDLKPYFVSRVAAITAQRGLAVAGWEDLLMNEQNIPFRRTDFANRTIIANAWDNIWEWGVADRAYRLANAGYQVILSSATHLYFDHPHEAHPDERGYYWATRFTGLDKVFGFRPDDLYANADTTRNGEPITDLVALTGKPLTKLTKPENILGIQGQVWSETVRTAEQLEQMLYPRLLALAERAWHRAAWENEPSTQSKQADWAAFSARAGQELQRLEAAGITVYLPPPGAVRHQQQLRINTLLPGLQPELSTDQGKSWQSYTPEMTLPENAFLLRSRTGKAVSRAVSIPANQ